jgi:hypothetical protein
MVDFNSEATIGTPALEVEKISILQRRYDFIEALEDYKKKRMMNTPQPISYASARLYSLFMEIEPMLKRRLTLNLYRELKSLCLNQQNEGLLIYGFELINEQLDKINLIKIDTNKVYDPTNVETENKIKGY